ncbi:MAG: polyprenyl diphosphate synthase [Acidimicrobiales bacterium]
MWTDPLYALYERHLVATLDPDRRPSHIGVILDGHRRFARAEGLSDYRASYEVGVAKFEQFLAWCRELSIPAVTAWVLSSENLGRSSAELDHLFQVLGGLLDRVGPLAGKLDASLRCIGSLDLLPAPLVEAAKSAEAEAATPGSWHVTIALGYGGRQEIVDACRALVADLARRGVPLAEMAEHITAESLGANLYQADVADPDLIIRTSGEARLSGFLLWQSAYAEFAFVDPFWPAFRRVDFLRALRDFGLRDRRFGR